MPPVLGSAELLTCDVLVVGTGLAGLSAAIAIAGSGFHTIVVGPPLDDARARRDTRTTALFTGSVEMLKNMGVWHRLHADAAPLGAIRLVDATGALWRAPEVLFHARELQLEAFGYNFQNTDLLLALQAHAATQRGLRLISGEATPVASDEGSAMAELTDGRRIVARLIVAADGRKSAFRVAAGIETRAWSYPQTAITLRFAHTRPHENVSIELHRVAGPLTTVPLRGNWSSLVWVETPQEAERLVTLDDDALAGVLEAHLQGALGAIGPLGARAAFPLSGLIARSFGARRVALVGETAHVFPPIGAQGLNLSYRDIAALVDEIERAAAAGEDIGGPHVLARYEAARRSDVESRTMMVDLLNRSLFAGVLPLHLARGAGLHLINSLRPLKELAMRQGLQPGGSVPRLMQPAQAVD